MEIPEIKARLTLKQVLDHYGLKPDKHLRLNCPFHDDKTPSLQVYYKTHTAYCFSSNCPTHGKSLDVIDFVMRQEHCSKHEAIKKCAGLLTENTSPVQELTRSAILARMFIYFKNAVHNSRPAREYLESRHLDHTKIEVGYNSGQFHHGVRRDRYLIESCIKVGLLLDRGLIGRTGEKAYRSFGKGCICLALKNSSGQVSGLYFRSITDQHNSRHFYLKNRQGLYPRYPEPTTSKLILTEAIIDAATLIQQEQITSQYEVLSLYGTNGLTDEHLTAIKGLKDLKEIVFWFDGDLAGRQATDKYKTILAEELSGVKLSSVLTPEDEDINSLPDGHSPEILSDLLEQRKLLEASKSAATSFSNESAPQGNEAGPDEEKNRAKPELDTTNPDNIRYGGTTADYYIKGGLKGRLDSLKVSLQIVHRESRRDHRAKADLYEYRQVASVSQKAGKTLGVEASLIENDLSQLTRLLEAYRDQQQNGRQNACQRRQVSVPRSAVNQCMEILRAKDPIQAINQLIEKAGVVGEETNRVFLCVIAASYKMPDTLHALIQGSSGSGKTRLLKTICELMPPEDTLKFTRVTDSSLYNYPENFFTHRLIGLEDIDGLKEDALLAVRELISNEVLKSSTTIKTESGELTGAQKIVRGPIASLSATTRGEVYEDNMSRVFLIAVDESEGQTERIIRYQQERAAGLIDPLEEQQARERLQNCIRLLKPYWVINPYAHRIQLPREAHKIRRLNDLYLSFVKQITLLNQYRRKKDKQGRLITEIQDLQTANAIMFESMVLKVDELDGALRAFYERLKAYAKDKGEDHQMSQREIRQAFGMSKTACQNRINALLELEYLTKTYVGVRNTYHYKISYWDSLKALRARIRNHLNRQLKDLDRPQGGGH